MQYFHFKQNKNQYTFQTAGQKYADKVFQIVSPKMCHVTQRHPLTMHDTLALGWFSFSRNVQFAVLIKQRVSARDAELIFIAI